jgi:hypothetical protein
LLSCIGLNELLAQTVNHGRRHETAGFEKSVHCRYARPASDPEDAGCRSAPGRPPRARVQLRWRGRARRVVAGHFAVMTINNRCPVAPNIGSARHMGQVHRLAFIAPLRAAPARPGRAVAASPHADERTSLSIHALDILLCDLPGSLHPSTVTPRAADNQTPDAIRSSAECTRPDFIQPWRDLAYRAPTAGHGETSEADTLCALLGRATPSSLVGRPRPVGRNLAASRRMSRGLSSIHPHSPTLRLNRSISSSRNASSSFRLCAQCVPRPDQKTFTPCFHLSALSPCRRPASATVALSLTS